MSRRAQDKVVEDFVSRRNLKDSIEESCSDVAQKLAEKTGRVWKVFIRKDYVLISEVE